jgi:hypothetical protein
LIFVDQNNNEKLNLKILKEIINFLIFSKKNLNFENQNNEKKNNDIYLILLDVFNGNYFFSDSINGSLPLSLPYSQPSPPISLPLSIETSSIAKLVNTEKYLWSVLNSDFPLDHVICPSKADAAQLSRHYRYIYLFMFVCMYTCIVKYMCVSIYI